MHRRLAGLLLAVIGCSLLPSAAEAAVTPITGVAQRIAGADRIATAIAASKANKGESDFVILATSADFPDALAAAALSADGDDEFAPVLLNPPDALRADVKDEIDRRLDPGENVLVIGGPTALSPGVASALQAAGYQVTRIAGADRFATAAAVADQLVDDGATAPEIVVATGSNFPDALAASPYAAATGVPILLTTATATPVPTQAFINEHARGGTVIHVIGGPAAAATPNLPAGASLDRVAGNDRFLTATQVAVQLFERAAGENDRDQASVLARGDNAGGGADALSGAPLAAAVAAPLYLTDPGIVPVATLDFVAGLGYDRPVKPAQSFVMGGESAVSKQAFDQWSAALLGLQRAPGRTSTLRSTVTGDGAPGAAVDVDGCGGSADEAVPVTWTLEVAGDVTAELKLDGVRLCATGDETFTVLPGAEVTLTTSNTSTKGTVTGGMQAATFMPNAPLPVGATRDTAIDFVLVGDVGHLSFVAPDDSDGAISRGYLALVSGATRLNFDGNFTGFPASGCGQATFDGAIGTTPVDLSFVACRSDGPVWRIGPGTVDGGVEGEVISGVRADTDLGLQLRTDAGLVDLYATVDDDGHAAGSSSPAMVQTLPEADDEVAFTAGPPGAPLPADESGGCSSVVTGRNLSGGKVEGTSFDGTLTLTALRECAVAASFGLVEPSVGEADPAAQHAPSSRPAFYAVADGNLRGRVLFGAFSQAEGERTFGITVLLEENRVGMTEGPLPPPAPTDLNSQSFTIVRLVVPAVPAANANPAPAEASVSFAR